MIRINFLLLTFLAIYLLKAGIEVFLHRLNLSYLGKYGRKVPEVFRDIIDQESLEKISSYTIDSQRFHIINFLAGEGFLLILLISGLLPWLSNTIIAKGFGTILSGLIFFGILWISSSLIRIPFNLYDIFVIEERYGFNRMTPKIWILDFIKSMAISILLGGLLLLILFILIIHGGKKWWIWAWVIVGGFELLILWLYPVVIAPLFNKFEPLENEELEKDIKMMVEKAGLRIKGIFKMDAGKRSRHTNAYFTGIGRTKRIVLFDTLLSSHKEDEILAVLSHEIGHWKKRHVLKQLILVESVSIIAFYIISNLMNWPLLYHTFGFQKPIFYIGLLLSGIFLSLLGYFIQPLESIISRRFEQEADDFALALMKRSEPLQRALKRLALDNLANLNPHPLYAWFFYSHPPLGERISRLAHKEVPFENKNQEIHI